MSSVVIIDDETLIRDLLCQMIERLGHKAIPFENGAEGLNFITNNSCDMVITDIVMPEVDGIELLRSLGELKRDFKIIAISGGGRIRSDNYLEIAQILGAHHSFEKPIDWKEFKEKITELLPDTKQQ